MDSETIARIREDSRALEQWAEDKQIACLPAREIAGFVLGKLIQGGAKSEDVIEYFRRALAIADQIKGSTESAGGVR